VAHQTCHPVGQRETNPDPLRPNNSRRSALRAIPPLEGDEISEGWSPADERPLAMLPSG